MVCREYKAPRHIDPKFLDAKAVFAELADPTPNNEAKVFNPDKKKRKREGYEEGDYTQYKSAPASEYIQTTDPIAMLGGLNAFHFDQPPNGDVALAAIDKMPETTEEVRNCCADLKVLGRRDFKLLLRWRLKIRDEFGFSAKKKKEAKEAADREAEEVAEVAPMDEEMATMEALQEMRDKADKSKKRERRRENERKQKEIVRMQMNMTTPKEIGMEAGEVGDDAMFSLKQVDRAGATGKIAKGGMHSIQTKHQDTGVQEGLEEEVSTDDEGDNLEGQLDSMYEQYQERRSERDAKYRAKKARQEHDDTFEGVSDQEKDNDSGDDLVEDNQSDQSSDESDIDETPLSRTVAAENQKEGALSRRAARFFDQDLFKDLGLPNVDVHDDSGIDMNDSDGSAKVGLALRSRPEKQAAKQDVSAEHGIPSKNAENDDDQSSEASFEVVKSAQQTEEEAAVAAEEDDWSEHPNKKIAERTRPNIDIITAEAMTLAHQLATGGKVAAEEALNSSYNRYAYRDTEGLPQWFLDDEGQHSKPHRPITAAAAAAIKEKQRALNARPIKKVREAKARKKMRAAQRLEKLKKKSALIAEDEEGGLTEGEKFKEMMKVMSKAGAKKPKRKVSVVVARHSNKGLQGRPKGVKGKYKMVDPRLKKDMRGLKRAEKRKTNKR